MRVSEHFLCDRIIGLHELCITIKILSDCQTLNKKKTYSEMKKENKKTVEKADRRFIREFVHSVGCRPDSDRHVSAVRQSGMEANHNVRVGRIPVSSAIKPL